MAARSGPRVLRAGRLLATALVAAALAACGGGGDGGSSGAPAACSLEAQQADLRANLDANYLWYAQIPPADPTAYGSLAAYLGAIVSPGVAGNPALPRDRWSGVQTTASFTQFFGDGQSVGYGVSVAGLEVAGTSQPLKVRYVEPASPAARAGVLRGDTIATVDGAPVGPRVLAGDFAWLNASAPGTVLTLGLQRADGSTAQVAITSAVYDLTPVSVRTVLTSPGNRRVGYLVLKDFISQANAPLDAAFADFRAQGVQDLIVDLRYNGGGLVQAAADLASRIQGRSGVAGQAFARLVYNDKSQGRNQTFAFNAQPSALGSLTRVYVITGSRTCSASELLVNGLKPFMQVVQVGATTCGKPVGFQPRDNGCGSTVSAVNFESFNRDGEGRFYDGLLPQCQRADDFARALGDPQETLTAIALAHADQGVCPPTTQAGGDTTAEARMGALQARAREAVRRGVPEPGEWRGMVVR